MEIKFETNVKFHEGKPQESGDYLLASFWEGEKVPMTFGITAYSAKWEKWNTRDGYDEERTKKYALEDDERVTRFWANVSDIKFPE